MLKGHEFENKSLQGGYQLCSFSLFLRALLNRNKFKNADMLMNELLTREDLQHFRTQLLNELKEVLQQSKQSTKQWLKSSEVKKLLGISHGTLQNLRASRVLPYSKVGGIMFYRYEDIHSLLEKGLVSRK